MKSVLLSLPFFSSLRSLHSGSLGNLIPKKPSFLPREWSSSVVSPHPRLQCLDDSQNVLIQFEYSSILCMSKDCQFLSEFQGLCFLNMLSKYSLMTLFISLVPTVMSPFSSNFIELGHIFLLVGLDKGQIPFSFQRAQFLFH